MIIFYTAVILIMGFFVGKFLRENKYKLAGILAGLILLFSIFLQISVGYVMSHPHYQYSGYYRY